MSEEQPVQGPALAPRRQISIRLDQIKRTPAISMLGLPELIGLAGAALLALLTVFAYFYFYLPANSRLKATDDQRNLLQVQKRGSEKLFEGTKTTSDEVSERLVSVNEFEGNWLSVSGPGRMSLYAELNNLIRSNGLRNTAGPSYSPLEPIGSKPQTQATESAEKQGIAKWQSIYPGVLVSVTVEGPYQSVRHFVRDIETSRHFLIINSVELEGVRDSGASQEMPMPLPATRIPSRTTGARPLVLSIQPAAGTRGSQVSLRLDLSMYFQRAEVKSASDATK
jgi:hypothetical protein